jgi:chitodextrinase
VVIIAYGLAPAITSATSVSGILNQPISYTIGASWSPTSFSATGLPAGLTLNPATGVVSGTVTGGPYTSTIAATNSAGSSSAVTITWNITADTMAPSTPTGLSATALGYDTFKLSWSAATDNVGVTSYQVECDGSVVTTESPITTTSNLLTGLTPGAIYLVNVRAGDAAGNWSAWSTPLAVTLLADTTVPTAVSNLNYATVSSDSAALVWTGASDNVGVAGYQIYRNGTLVGTTGPVTSFVDTALTANTTYSYTVVAFDGAGNLSTSSSSLSVTTSADLGLDSDHDGAPDAIEILLGTNVHSAATIDSSNSLQMTMQRPAP